MLMTVTTFQMAVPHASRFLYNAFHRIRPGIEQILPQHDILQLDLGLVSVRTKYVECMEI